MNDNKHKSNPCYEYAIWLTKEILHKKVPLNMILEQHYPKYYTKMMETLDMFNQTSPHPITCKKNCDACCHYQVASVPMEAKYIHFQAKKNMSSKHYKIVLRKITLVRTKEREIEAQFPNDFIRQAKAYRLQKISCPFLYDKTCMIYNYRPMICRYHNVTSPPEYCYSDATIQQVNPWKHPDLMVSDVNFQLFLSRYYLNNANQGSLNRLLLENGF
jgi:Fe-S-cluster containining protein